MEIAIAHVADDGRSKGDVGKIILGFGNALRKAGNGYANVGGQYFGTRDQGVGREVGIMSRVPELVHILRIRFPLEAPSAVFRRQRLQHRRLVPHIAIVHAMELEEQGWQNRQVNFRVQIYGFNLFVIEKFDARQTDSELNRLNNSFDRALHGVERAECDGYFLGQRVQA
jgi:hypothetical protein